MSQQANIMERVVQGDLGQLTPEQRVAYAVRVCETLNLNPATAPFQFVSFQGKTKLYATKDCTEQLRRRDRVSVKIVARELLPNETYVVTAQATMPGDDPPRTDESMGAVSLRGLAGEAIANAIMKAETKAKRRVTLSICGLGFLDESELDSLTGATTAQAAAPSRPSLPHKPDQRREKLQDLFDRLPESVQQAFLKWADGSFTLSDVPATRLDQSINFLTAKLTKLEAEAKCKLPVGTTPAPVAAVKTQEPGFASREQLREIEQLIVDNGFIDRDYLAGWNLKPGQPIVAEVAVKMIADLHAQMSDNGIDEPPAPVHARAG